MTPSQELKHSKSMLIISQKAFAENPSATNWQRVLFHMEYYQELFNNNQQLLSKLSKGVYA